eukprot:SRR837773.3025.p1 GENE.SRR837773.3025~~SRR837773.3025.p1  ORF type:complete len:269 (+),score=22.52 SRR837773.3025:35-841(+)
MAVRVWLFTSCTSLTLAGAAVLHSREGAEAPAPSGDEADLNDLVHGVVQDYVAGAFPSAGRGDDIEGQFVGWHGGQVSPSSTQTSEVHAGSTPLNHGADKGLVASGPAASRTGSTPKLVRRQSFANAESSVIALRASSALGLDTCTSGPEDYKGHFCNYTSEHVVCARIGATAELHGNLNFWTVTHHTPWHPSDAAGWECIGKSDFDTYVGANGCELEVKCDATHRNELCETIHENGAYLLNSAQKCIAEACGGLCGHHSSGTDEGGQ